MDMNDLVQVAVLGVSTGFGSAFGAELAKSLVGKLLEKGKKVK